MENRFEIRGDVTIIFLKRNGRCPLEAIIDTDDLPLVDSFDLTWVGQAKKGSDKYYVKCMKRSDGKSVTIQLHRIIADAGLGYVVDHMNHNPLDNRKQNLRVITQAQNAQNRSGPNKCSSSGVRGVSWTKRNNKWEAYTYSNKKRVFLGYFDHKAEAESAVREARSKIMPYSVEGSMKSLPHREALLI